MQSVLRFYGKRKTQAPETSGIILTICYASLQCNWPFAVPGFRSATLQFYTAIGCSRGFENKTPSFIFALRALPETIACNANWMWAFWLKHYIWARRLTFKAVQAFPSRMKNMNSLFRSSFWTSTLSQLLYTKFSVNNSIQNPDVFFI